ncbi:MAG: photosynthetic complex assembly protein PuhC [Pseudomonadota bacterium]
MNHHSQPIPDSQRTDKIEGIHKLPLFGALAVVVLTVVVVIGAMQTDTGRVTRTIGEPIAERELLFRDGPKGTVIVRDAETKAVIATYGRGEGAFIRQSMRALSYNRTHYATERGQPYRLVKTAAGKLSIVDPVTGKFIKLNAFGAVAMEGFSALLQRAPDSANLTSTSEKGA